ncbi:MAG: 1,4-alpha-glucan branching protein GlgB [Ardenticatenales bacterium]|nr:1,4-alpha-glucan branching protein GlgB [Ardenticatenales bacterium]
MSTVSSDQLNRIVYAFHHDPFQVLGAHRQEGGKNGGVAIRTFRPEAHQVHLVRLDTGERLEMKRLHDYGFYEVLLPTAAFFPYEFELALYDGQVRREQDPYRFPPVLGEMDLQLIGEGKHHHVYNRLGAQLIEHQGVKGTAFALWAPGAQRVSVIGNFNGWDGRRHLMRVRGSSGIWELFIPGLVEGELYKYQLLGQNGQVIEKADPYAFATEMRPKTASKVWNIERYEWQDAEWLRARLKRNAFQEPMNIYEAHLTSWARSPDNPDKYLDYRHLAHRLVDYVKEMGYTHIELLPITEYPYDGSWGYQVTGYFAPTSRLGTPDDFMYFVDHCHRNNIGVLVDWVPAHFPKDEHGLARFDGSALYEHSDWRLGEHKDWGTYIFNYGRNEVRNFLISSALFWLDKYHIDGIRVDAVASMLYLDYSREPGQWVPNRFGGRENLDAIEFLRQLNELTHHYHPGIITVAEESTSFPFVTRPTYLGGLGFDFKWNMGWMNDSLAYIQADPIYRKYEHNKLTFGLMYAFSEHFVLPISHDEVVHLKHSMAAKMPGDWWQQMASLRTYYGFMFTHPGKKLLFQGQDIGQWTEFNEDRSVDWHLLQHEQHRGLNRWVHDLLHLVKNEPALHEQDHSWEGFQWIDVNDWENSIISYLRFARDREDFLVVIHNFTPVVRHGYHIGVPTGGTYLEVLNSDASNYWGSGIGNQGQIHADDQPWMGFPHGMLLSLPPMSTLVLKPRREKSIEVEEGATPVLTEQEVRGSAAQASERPGWVDNIALKGGETPALASPVPADAAPFFVDTTRIDAAPAAESVEEASPPPAEVKEPAPKQVRRRKKKGDEGK